MNRLSQSIHWVAIKRILHYITGTQKHEILLRKMRDFGITAYCNSDWGGDTIDRKRMFGFLVYTGGNLVSWASRKQGTLARSSTMVEYRAIATTTQEIKVVWSVLVELGVTVLLLMTILMDNLRASFIARNPIGHIRLKHVALDLHFVREKIDNGTLVVNHFSGKDQWADILTKPLPPKAFIEFQANHVKEALRAWGGGVLDQSMNSQGRYWLVKVVRISY